MIVVARRARRGRVFSDGVLDDKVSVLEFGAMQRVECICSHVDGFVLHEGELTMELDSYDTAKGLEQVLQILLYHLFGVIVDNEQGLVGGQVAAAARNFATTHGACADGSAQSLRAERKRAHDTYHHRGTTRREACVAGAL